MNNNVTRGNGLLENFLSQKRANIANSLISDKLRKGIILDIGCGHFPYFLSKVKFEKKLVLTKKLAKRKMTTLY